MTSGAYKAIAEYYDAEYAHLDYLSRDVPFLISRLGKRRRTVLELAVGTGRAAVPLAQAGHRVVGVDNDPAVLAIARRKASFVGLGADQLRLVRGDARKVKLDGKFDDALILFNTFLNFTTLGDMDAVLETCRRHLKRGGRVWIDVMYPDLSLLAERYSYGLDPVTFHVPGLDRTVSRTTDLEDVSPQVRRVRFVYRWFDDGEERVERAEFLLTWLMPREMVCLLERNGFGVEGMWGDYDGSEVTVQSPRIIVAGRC